MGILTESQVAQYRETGLLHLTGLLSKNAIDALSTAARTVIPKLPAAKDKWMHFHELHRESGERILCRTENFVDFVETVGEVLGKDGRVQEVVEEVAKCGMVLFKDKLNYKQPGASGFQPHQDSPAFSSTPSSSTHLTVLIPIDPMTSANGYLEFVPGDYSGQVLPQEPDGTISRSWCEEQKWTGLECGQGDVVLFSGLVPHRSGDNNTERSRAAYYLTYNAAAEGDLRASYWAEKRTHFPPKDEREPGKDYSEGAKKFNLGNPIVD